MEPSCCDGPAARRDANREKHGSGCGFPADRRSLLVALTPAGRSLTEAAIDAHTRAMTGLVASLDEGDQGRLAALLRTVVLGGGEPAESGDQRRATPSHL